MCCVSQSRAMSQMMSHSYNNDLPPSSPLCVLADVRGKDTFSIQRHKHGASNVGLTHQTTLARAITRRNFSSACFSCSAHLFAVDIGGIELVHCATVTRGTTFIEVVSPSSTVHFYCILKRRADFFSIFFLVCFLISFFPFY